MAGGTIKRLVRDIQKVRAAAARMQCTNNLKQIGIALHAYHDTNNKLPVGSVDDDNRSFCWRTYILPYLEQGALFDQMKTAGLWLPPNMGGGSNGGNVDAQAGSEISTASAALQALCKTRLNVYICPSDILPEVDNDGFYKTNYLGNIGTPPLAASVADLSSCANGNSRPNNQNGMFLFSNENDNNAVVRFADVTDGLSNTLCVGEGTVTANITPSTTNDGRYPIWASGNNNGGCSGIANAGAVFRFATRYTPVPGTTTAASNDYFINRRTGAESNMCFGSQHTGGSNFLIGDGSVRTVTDSVSQNVFAAAGTRNGGEVDSLN